jgi:CRP-like cAMP-binding protein
MARSKGGEPAGGGLQALRGCEIGGALSPPTLSRLARAAVLEDRPREDEIYGLGAPATRFWVVCAGRVRVVREGRDAGPVILGHRFAGTLVGEWGLLGRAAQADTAVVAEDARLLSVPLAAARPALDADPRLHAALVGLAASRRLAAEAGLEALATRTVRSRLAEFLLEATKQDGVTEPRGVRIQARYTHLELAHTVGATRETTTVTLDEMKRKGVLIVERRRLIVRDVAKLRAMI